MLEQPASFDSRLTLLDGRSLGWSEYGDPSGFPVVFFHGWPGSRHQGARLDTAGWVVGVRVIAPERPGYGLSDFRPGWTMLDYADDVATLADVLGLDRFAVFGASGGGPYALACASRHPERVSAVALASSFGPADAPEVRQAMPLWRRALVARYVPTHNAMAVGLRVVSRRALADPEGYLDSMLRYLPPCDRAIVSQPDYRAIAARDITTALEDGGRAAARDAQLLFQAWPFHLEEISSPVHLWYGGMDPLVPPAMGHHQARAIPNTTAHYLPNEGHYLMVPRAVEILSRVNSEQ